MGYSTSPKYLPKHVYLFTGTIAEIPAGMQLCDGTNGTVDLRNRFVVCADADSAGQAMTTVTGSAQKSGDGQIPAHTHAFTVVDVGGIGYNYAVGNNGTQQGDIATKSTGTGTKNVAVFYALAFIQMIGG